jgi:hypothetical protein
MKPIAALVLTAFLAACGVETATTAATSAEIKRRELEAAKATMKQATESIEKNTQLQLQKAAEAEKSSKD